jgi:rod shape determining protein RodA
MAHIPERRSLRRRLRPYFTVFDLPLTLILAVLVTISMITMSSAGADFPDRVEHQIRNFLLSFAVMWIAANIAPQTLMRLAVPIY